MKHKHILYVATVLSLALASTWAGADTTINSAALSQSPARAEGAVAVKRAVGDKPGPVAHHSARTDDSDQIIDCFYGYNEYHPVCQETKSGGTETLK